MRIEYIKNVEQKTSVDGWSQEGVSIHQIETTGNTGFYSYSWLLQKVHRRSIERKKFLQRKMEEHQTKEVYE